jgi:hypothetical protein
MIMVGDCRGSAGEGNMRYGGGGALNECVRVVEVGRTSHHGEAG